MHMLQHHHINNKTIESVFQRHNIQTMDQQLIANMIESIKYLASLNVPVINLIVKCFLGMHHQKQNDWIEEMASYPSVALSPPDLLDRILSICISEAWGNSRSLPYTPIALRKDVPLQRGLDVALRNLQQSASTDLSYANMQEAYQKNLRHVQRALELARKNDPDYLEIISTHQRLRPGTRTGDWNKFLAALESSLQSTNMRQKGIDATLYAFESRIANIWSNQGQSEESHAELPLLYARILYTIASNGMSPSAPQFKHSTCYTILSEYFDQTIFSKLEEFTGVEPRNDLQRERKKSLEADKALLAILASRQTDWDSVYRVLQLSTATGMASVSHVL